ncbi:ABC transporter ATP-binding protein [Calothrix rhizosoleniae]|uniref:ABC transporter ATP-binding protein n=1 Tax=Calothrix rhizosoleniae TaxID=888997 RepID=UPI000B49AA48|nr:ABC transporter ATP-binding protein [Calothrix rhizosoleniae]
MLKYFSKVWYILKGSRKRLPLLILTFALSSILEAIGIGFIGAFLNLASNPKSIHKIPFLDWFYMQLGLESTSQFISVLGLIIAGVFCIKSLLYFLARSYMIKFSFDQEAKLASRLIRAYLTVPYTFYLRKNTAALIKNITHETMRINHDCLQPSLTIIANSIVVSALLFILARTDLILLLMIVLIILPTFLMFYQLKNKFKRWGKELSESNQEIIRVVNHSLGSLKETRVIGCEAYFQDQMEHQAQRYSTAGTRTDSSGILPRIIIEASLIVFVLLFISVSQLLFNQSFQDITSVMAVFSLASVRLIPAVSHTIQAMSKLQNSSYSVNVIYSDLKEIEKEEYVKNIVFQSNSIRTDSSSINYAKKQPISFENQIKIRDIIYSYPYTSEPVLNKICLTIKKGQSIGLIGKSGAGKTTLVDVILGLLYPEGGEIMVDNVSIYKDIRSWQNLIGYIPQSIFLMDDTVEKNIAFGVPDHLIDGEKLNNAIKSAQLEELVEQLPNGIKTSVGERGVRLSGGQRQRIGIARALYHEREILVLDEATSALDNETEGLLNEAIKSLAGKKTLIIITHRLSTIEHCDNVYLLEKGRVSKSGSYQEVVMGNLSV